MADAPVIPKHTVNRPRYTAARVMGLLLLGHLVILIVAVAQSRQRETVERIESPSALGDEAYFVPQRPYHWQHPVTTVADVPLFLESLEPLHRADVTMRKAGRERHHFLYQEANGDGTYYMKQADGTYLPLGPH